MPKLRTIIQCYEMIRSEDSLTAITPYFIRSLCNSRSVRFINAGNKILVDYDSLINYLKLS
jgi:hypothetical protein